MCLTELWGWVWVLMSSVSWWVCDLPLSSPPHTHPHTHPCAHAHTHTHSCRMWCSNAGTSRIHCYALRSVWRVPLLPLHLHHVLHTDLCHLHWWNCECTKWAVPLGRSITLTLLGYSGGINWLKLSVCILRHKMSLCFSRVLSHWRRNHVTGRDGECKKFFLFLSVVNVCSCLLALDCSHLDSALSFVECIAWCGSGPDPYL